MAESFTVFINPNYNSTERLEIGATIINYIINRTKNGYGIGNVSFRNRLGQNSYTNTYQNHRDYQIAGKTSNPINLTLTGDMLDSIEILDNTLAGRIVIGINDGPNADKAKYMREKGYNFLGLSETEKNKILSKFSKVTQQEIISSQITESVAKTFLKGLINGR